VGDRAVPQYFVMIGGGVDDGGASFGRLAAKIPARRVPQAVERLVALYRMEGAEGEAAAVFFRKIEVPRVKALLADLEALTPEDARPEDFVDLGEDAAFKVETQEGECVA
jgi:sulfite reductase (NADPH) hemoprotein beta-component